MKGNNKPCFNLVEDNDVLKQGLFVRDNIDIDTYKLIVSLQKTIEDLVTKVADLEYSKLEQEARILKLKLRVTNLEKHLGANDNYCIWEDLDYEDREPLQPIYEQFSLLSDRINDTSIPVLKETVYAGNITTIRRKFFRDWLKDSPLKNGLRQRDSRETKQFFLTEIQDEYKATTKNADKVVFDVFHGENSEGYIRLTKNKKRLSVAVYLEKQ
jgi:hypothetical protein